MTWSRQIALHISHLYEAPFKIIKRDLKSITAHMVMKLFDFHSFRHFYQTKISIAGTSPWIKPEVIQSITVLNYVTYFPMVKSCERCWLEKFLSKVWRPCMWLLGEVRLAISTSCSEKFAKLLKCHWFTKSKQRRSFKQSVFTVQHGQMWNLGWDKLICSK